MIAATHLLTESTMPLLFLLGLVFLLAAARPGSTGSPETTVGLTLVFGCLAAFPRVAGFRTSCAYDLFCQESAGVFWMVSTTTAAG